MEKVPQNEPAPRNEQERELDEAERWIEGDPRERKVFVWATGIAIALHAALLFARLPDWGPEPVRVDAPEMAMKVQFMEPPPPAPPKVPEPPKPETRKIPRPDPAPDKPEPKAAPEPEPAPAPPMSPAPPAPAGPVRVAPGQGPGLIKRVEPVYPPPARAARMEGTVILDAVILADGSVSDVTVIKSANPMFDKAAMNALKQWRFTPGNQDVVMSLTVHFQLRR